LGDVVPPSLKLWRTGADSQETGGGVLVTDSQRDGRDRAGRGFARSWEEKVRRGRGLADWGLKGVSPGAQGIADSDAAQISASAENTAAVIRSYGNEATACLLCLRE
jgi:hypothetical protein